jgi:Protein of unknown function (DUF3800)
MFTFHDSGPSTVWAAGRTCVGGSPGCSLCGGIGCTCSTLTSQDNPPALTQGTSSWVGWPSTRTIAGRSPRVWPGCSESGLVHPFASLELHASRMWSGRHEWARVPETDRRNALKAIHRHLAKWPTPSGNDLALFAVAVHKPSFPVHALERAHEELFARFDEFITRQLHGGKRHRSVVIADDSSYEKLVQTLVRQWKSPKSRTGALHSFAEVPLYVDSKASALVQAADFVSWATWQYFEHGHVDHVQRLHARFDHHGGIQHGVAHLVRWLPKMQLHPMREPPNARHPDASPSAPACMIDRRLGDIRVPVQSSLPEWERSSSSTSTISRYGAPRTRDPPARRPDHRRAGGQGRRARR